MSERPEFWKQLVKKIKQRYNGKLTYAENWDKITNVPFWSQLDYIGIDAYFPLSDEKTPELSELKKGWEKHKNKIEKLQGKVNKQVLFTEYGYRSVDYAAEEPWNYDKKLFSKVNHEVQTRSLQALYDEFWKEEWFAGGFLWKWFDYHEKAGGKEHTEFTPQNKPAEVLIREFYKSN